MTGHLHLRLLLILSGRQAGYDLLCCSGIRICLHLLINRWSFDMAEVAEVEKRVDEEVSQLRAKDRGEQLFDL